MPRNDGLGKWENQTTSCSRIDPEGRCAFCDRPIGLICREGVIRCADQERCAQRIILREEPRF